MSTQQPFTVGAQVLMEMGVPGRTAAHIDKVLTAHDALVEALEAFRRAVDVSTIGPGKKNEERWTALLEKADAALAKVEK